MLSPKSRRFVLLGRGSRYVFITSTEGEEDYTCLMKEESSFVARADDQTQDTQIRNLAYSDNHYHWALNEVPPCAPFWQIENQLSDISCIGDLLDELPTGIDYCGSVAWHNDFSRRE